MIDRVRHIINVNYENKGPRTDPCGTPDMTSLDEEVTPMTVAQ